MLTRNVNNTYKMQLPDDLRDIVSASSSTELRKNKESLCKWLKLPTTLHTIELDAEGLIDEDTNLWLEVASIGTPNT